MLPSSFVKTTDTLQLDSECDCAVITVIHAHRSIYFVRYVISNEYPSSAIRSGRSHVDEPRIGIRADGSRAAIGRSLEHESDNYVAVACAGSSRVGEGARTDDAAILLQDAGL